MIDVCTSIPIDSERRFDMYIILLSFSLLNGVYSAAILENNVCSTFDAYRTIRTNKNCYFNLDVESTPYEIAKRYGYFLEQHVVTSEDGYILTIFRLVDTKGKKVGNRQPLVVEHGILLDGISWMVSGNDSLAFYFADAGFDVWLINSRGTTLSRKHTNGSISERDYWNFSFHEMAIYDTPQIMELISNHTNRFDIIHIGHSMGTTSSMIYSILKSDHARKHVKGLIQLAPVVTISKLSGGGQLVIPFFELLRRVLEFLGVYSIESIPLMRRLVTLLCSRFPTIIICRIVEALVSGFVAKQVHARLNVLYEKNWTRLVTEQLKRFERAVVESGKGEDSFHSARSHWTFGGALLYSVTLLTTVGYDRLSPKTALGKIVAMVYAIIGVPLMLILLSTFGNILATGARKGYSKICCHNNNNNMIKDPPVGYHRAPSSPPGKYYCKSYEDSASIQIASTNSTPNHVNCKSNHHPHHIDHQEVPKRAILATVRSTHTRGRCRQGPVRQTLADTPVSMCPTHMNHGTPMRNSLNSSIVGITPSDLEDADDTEENEHVVCTTHDTPSRIPLIWRPPELDRPSPTPSVTTPSVPALLVVIIFLSYVCIGALAFSSSSGWSFLDAIYFCFIAISTIGVGDRLPQTSEFYNQVQLFACCIYLFLGLVVVAMCFSLVQEEVALKCRQFANNVGLLRN